MAMSEEQKNKLVNLGALDAVAKKLKEAANQAAAEAAAAAQAAANEASRADAAEKAIDAKAVANAAAIAEINNADTGLLAQAKSHAQGLVDGEKGLREQADTALDTRIKALEGIVSGDSEVTLGDIIADVEKNAEAIETLNGDVNTIGSVAAAVAAEQGRAEGQEAAIRSEFAAVDIAIRQEMANEATRVNEKIADDIAAESALRVAEEARIEGKVNAEAQRADTEEKRIAGLVEAEAQTARAAEKANADAIKVLNGDENADGSVKKQIKDAIDAVNQAADGLEDRVKDNENILAIVQGADTVEGSIAKAKKDAQAYADEKIAALVASAPEDLNTLQELAKAIEDHQDVYDSYVSAVSGELAKKVDKVEGSRLISETEAAGYAAKAEVKDVENALQAAKTYADGKDTAMDIRMDAVEEFVEGHDHEAMIGRIAALEAHHTGENSVEAKIAAVETKANQAQNDVDAVELRVNDLEAFKNVHSHEAIEQGIAANGTAIENEVKQGGARDVAIAAAVSKHDTEVRGMLATVINSLGISIENNQLKLTLGTEDYVIKTAELNVVSDTDITELLDSLQ